MVVVVDLTDWPRFYIRAAIGLGIDKVVGLAIGGTISTGTDIAVGFFGLSLW